MRRKERIESFLDFIRSGACKSGHLLESVEHFSGISDIGLRTVNEYVSVLKASGRIVLKKDPNHWDRKIEVI